MTGDHPIPIIEFRPRPFAVCRDTDDDEPADDRLVVVGWGMTLPDGSSIVVGCDDGRSTRTLTIASSPERAAWILGGDVVWEPGRP